MGTNASQMMQVVYMVKAMYFASLKLAGTLRVFGRELQKRQEKFHHAKIARGLIKPATQKIAVNHFFFIQTDVFIPFYKEVT